MKEYSSVVLNGYTTKLFLDKALNELAKEGFSIHSTIMDHIIIMVRNLPPEPDVVVIEPKTFNIPKYDV